MNHFTDIAITEMILMFLNVLCRPKKNKNFKNFGIQTKNFNRDAWSFDWQK